MQLNPKAFHGSTWPATISKAATWCCASGLGGNGKLPTALGTLVQTGPGTGALEQPGFFSVAMRTIATLLPQDGLEK